MDRRRISKTHGYLNEKQIKDHTKAGRINKANKVPKTTQSQQLKCRYFLPFLFFLALCGLCLCLSLCFGVCVFVCACLWLRLLDFVFDFDFDFDLPLFRSLSLSDLLWYILVLARVRVRVKIKPNGAIRGRLCTVTSRLF